MNRAMSFAMSECAHEMFAVKTRTPMQTANVARRLAKLAPPPPMHIHLQGELGAGKSLFARAMINVLSGEKNAPSPSFALALSYYSPRMRLHHLDLFRLRQDAPLPGELSELLQDEGALCIIEWPRRASDVPSPDIGAQFDFADEDNRDIIFAAESEKGRQWLRAYFC